MPSKIIPQKHKDAMVEAYLAGSTAKKSAEPFGYSWMACISELKRRNIVPRTNSKTHRKYKLDETFFDVIDTETKAYWLGFLTADGNIRKTAVQLHLAVKDRGHLEKFIIDLNAEHPIYDRTTKTKGKSHKVCGVSIGSIKLANAIQLLGVSPKKSLTVKPCQVVPANLLHHYWRGIIDGDGCLQQQKDKKRPTPKWTINLVGSKAICKGFSEWVSGFAKSKAKVRPRHKTKVFNIGYSGNGIATSVIKRLYKDAKVFMDRKMARASLAFDIEALV